MPEQAPLPSLELVEPALDELVVVLLAADLERILNLELPPVTPASALRHAWGREEGRRTRCESRPSYCAGGP